jgi:hypothetical protein
MIKTNDIQQVKLGTDNSVTPMHMVGRGVAKYRRDALAVRYVL